MVMSTQTTIAALKTRHSAGSTCEVGKCDACTALDLLQQHRDALLSLQERISKGQVDAVGFATTIREGLGTTARG